MKKEKSIFLGHEFGNYSGWGIGCKNIFENLKKQTIKNTFFFFSYRMNFDKNNSLILAKLLSYKSRFKKFLIFLDIIVILLHIKNVKIKTIYCYVEFYIPLAFFLTKILKCNLVLYIHGSHSVLPYYTKMNKIYLSAFRKAIIHSNSITTRNIFLNTWNIKKEVKVLTPGANKLIFKPNITVKKENIFIFVGLFKKRKGLIPALEAFVNFSKKNKGYNFEIICDQDLVGSANYYEQQVLEYIKNFKNIYFVGKLSNKHLVQKYRSCLANVLISIPDQKNFEGFGLIHVEANLCGTLTIGGENTANEEIISHGKNGYLANSNDIKSIERCYQNVIEKYKNTSKKTISKICFNEGNKFDWQTISNEIEKELNY